MTSTASLGVAAPSFSVAYRMGSAVTAYGTVYRWHTIADGTEQASETTALCGAPLSGAPILTDDPQYDTCGIRRAAPCPTCAGAEYAAREQHARLAAAMTSPTDELTAANAQVRFESIALHGYLLACQANGIEPTSARLAPYRTALGRAQAALLALIPEPQLTVETPAEAPFPVVADPAELTREQAMTIGRRLDAAAKDLRELIASIAPLVADKRCNDSAKWLARKFGPAVPEVKPLLCVSAHFRDGAWTVVIRRDGKFYATTIGATAQAAA